MDIDAPHDGAAAPDVVIVGAGPAGLMASIVAARAGVRVALLEAGPRPGRKLLASGGGRCNLTNTLPVDEFVARFGGHGRFMLPSLAGLDHAGLRRFLADLGVVTHAPDGFRVFPEGHRAADVLTALLQEVERLRVPIRTGCPVTGLLTDAGRVAGVQTPKGPVPARAVIMATGGCGYPQLGGDLSGCRVAEAAGHRLVPAYPGMVGLLLRESWPVTCTAHTIPRALLRVRRPGKRPVEGRGDLIFTADGLAGPVVLDLAREITPLLAEHGELPLALHLNAHGEDYWRTRLQDARTGAPGQPVAHHLAGAEGIPPELAVVHCAAADIGADLPLERLDRRALNRLAATLDHLTVTITGHAGWDRAMVMRGGVSLKDVRPDTLESRRLGGLYFAGEMLDLDGPCGGFNLQWSFASGHQAARAATLPPPAPSPRVMDQRS